MRSRILLIIATLAVPAVAQQPVSPDNPAVVPAEQPATAPAGDQGEITITGEKPEDAKKKTICRSSVATGSIMPKRVCRTQEEWDRITARSLEDIEKMRAERRARDHVQSMRESLK